MSGRVLALDVGNRRIGVALSDPLGLLARGLTTVERTSTDQAIGVIVALVREWQPQSVVVGLPRNMDETLGEQAQRVLDFTRRLESQLDVPLTMWDERLSTVSASEILQRQGVRAKDQKGRIDAVAAAVILQDYLDTQRAENGVVGLLPPDPPVLTDTGSAPRHGRDRRRGRRERP